MEEGGRERERERERSEIYYKEMLHVIMEAEKFQDLQLASWRLKRACSTVPI